MGKSIQSEETKAYLDTLRERAKTSHVYRKYQLIGLLISQILEDEKHKALYIKLAKEHDEERLLALAKDIAERKNIQNKGAYFMRVWQIRFKRYTAIPVKKKKAKLKNGKKSKNSDRQ